MAKSKKECWWSQQDQSREEGKQNYAQYGCLNDGGREKAGYKGDANDCVVRAISIATEISYQEVYDQLNVLAKKERRGKRKKTVSNSRLGVYRSTYERFLKSIGWAWQPTMKIGQGCKVHLRGDELPKGRLVVSVSRHLTAVVDGVIHDTHDPSRFGERCVYGYYYKPNKIDCDENN
jgi:hypothetical protein